MDDGAVTIVGIDEAGYGPTLGPLVVGVAAFRAPKSVRSLGEALSAVAGARGPVPVDDSKRLYRGGAGLGVLERSVLAFASHALTASVPDALRDRPAWAEGFPPSLPAAAGPDEVRAAAGALGEALRATGVTVLRLATRTVGVLEYNREVLRRGTKSAVLFAAAMELAEPYVRGEGDARIDVDRHGGRAYYSGPLTASFPDLCHLATGETAGRSTYVFLRPSGRVAMTFEVGGDGKHLATALASMSAKWVRELHMASFNAYFSARCPGLLPTAGYALDARRWLEESAPLRRRMGIPEEELVRIR